MAAFIFVLVCLFIIIAAVVLKVVSIEKRTKADKEWFEKFENM